MCIGALLFGAVLLAGCTWSVVSLLETGLGLWRRKLGLVASAFGAMLGVVAVFGAFHAHGDDARVSVVTVPVVMVLAEIPADPAAAAAGCRSDHLPGLLAGARGRPVASS